MAVKKIVSKTADVVNVKRTDMRVKVRDNDKRFIPMAQTIGAAGLDLVLADDVILREGEVTKVGTGAYVEIPDGYVGLVFMRSSVSDIALTNGVGVIDSDYRGEIILKLRGTSRYTRRSAGERVAQLVILQYLPINVVLTNELSDTTRGDGGFGSTGVSNDTVEVQE